MRPKTALALAGLLLGALSAAARPAAAWTAASPATGPRGEAAHAAVLERLDQRPSPAAGFDVDSAWNEIASKFRSACEDHLVVGASLMFVRGAEVLGFETFGHADRAGDRPVDRDTIFHWASITKTFTGITMMQLRDRGLLSLDDRAVQRLPELRAVHDPDGAWLDVLTLRHLLSHSAGFRSSTWPWGGAQPWHPHEPTQYAQLVAMLPYTEIEFEPGSRYQYSNPGIVFLGRTIELLTGDDYEVQVDKNVLRPLGMHRSYFDVTPYHLRRHRSHSYQRPDHQQHEAQRAAEDLGPDFDTGVTVSNGGLNAPLPDMARYLAFLLGAVDPDSNAAHVLARDSLEEMWQPLVSTSRDGSEQMGLTFFLQQRGEQRFVTHTGGQRSFITFFYVHPASGTGALGAFNTNTAGPVMATLRRACMDRLSLPLAQQRQGRR